MTPDFSLPSDWYKTFFTDTVVRFWEAVASPPMTEAEIAFVIRHLGARPPAAILDVPCGNGRHALGLAKAGFTVTGVDISEAALKRAEALAHAQDIPARFVRSDMLELEVDEPHDALICMGNSIGYFEPTLTRILLGRLASALRPGGRLILDTSICAESLFPFSPHRSFSFPGGSYEQVVTYDPMQSTIKTRAQLTIDGDGHELRYHHFVMTSGELVRAARSAGFTVAALYGDAQDRPFEPGSPRLLLVAVRE